MNEVKHYKVNNLPSSPQPDAIYFVPSGVGSTLDLYVTDKNGVARQVSGSSGAETDPLFNVWLATPPDLSEFNNDLGFITSYTETDPIWLSEKASYLTIASAASTYSVLGHAHTFASLTSKPTTLSGYGITDAYPLSSNPAGYLTSFSESDPIYTASSWFSTTNNNSNWNTAFGWGNHASAGYLTSLGIGTLTQAHDVDLDAIAALGFTSAAYLKKTAANTWTLDTTVLDNGTYAPTRTIVSNLASASITTAQYLRVGNTVTVSGEFTAQATAASGTLTRFRVTLPIASNLAQTYQCNGTAYCGVQASVALGAAIRADVTNDQAEFAWGATSTSSLTYSYSFTYQII